MSRVPRGREGAAEPPDLGPAEVPRARAPGDKGQAVGGSAGSERQAPCRPVPGLPPRTRLWCSVRGCRARCGRETCGRQGAATRGRRAAQTHTARPRRALGSAGPGLHGHPPRPHPRDLIGFQPRRAPPLLTLIGHRGSDGPPGGGASSTRGRGPRDPEWMGPGGAGAASPRLSGPGARYHQLTGAQRKAGTLDSSPRPAPLLQTAHKNQVPKLNV